MLVAPAVSFAPFFLCEFAATLLPSFSLYCFNGATQPSVWKQTDEKRPSRFPLSSLTRLEPPLPSSAHVKNEKQDVVPDQTDADAPLPAAAPEAVASTSVEA